MPIITTEAGDRLTTEGGIPIRTEDEWHDSAFRRRKKITIDEANVAADLTDYPVLVRRVADTDFRAEVVSSWNRAYYDSAGTLLPFDEIFVDTNATDGTLIDRVKKPTVHTSPAGNDNVIWLYYAKEGPAEPDAASTYPSQYAEVYHCGDASSASSILDTRAAVDLTDNAGSLSRVDGPIKWAANFTAANDYARRNLAGVTTTATCTLTCLFKPAAAQQGGLVWVGDSASGNKYATVFTLAAGQVRGQFRNGANDNADCANSYSTSEWNHVAVRFDTGGGASAIRVRLNGDAANEGTSTITVAAPANNRTAIGRLEDNTPSNSFEGAIAEVRIYNGVLADAWVTFEKFNDLETDNELTWGPEEGTLIVQDAVHAHAADNAGVSMTSGLTVADCLHAHAADQITPAPTVTHVMAIDDGLHAHAAESPTVGVIHVPRIAELRHAHAAESPAIRVTHVMAIDDALHDHIADNATTQLVILAGTADGLHDHACESPTITQQHYLAIADAASGHTVTTIDFIQTGPAGISRLVHRYRADNLVLTQLHTLAIDDAWHDHLADNAATQLVILAGTADGLHDHACESPTITQQHTLAIADAPHAHAADAVGLTVTYAAATDDAQHRHQADNLVVTQAHTLAIDDALQLHAAEQPAPLLTYLLAVAGGVHDYAADNAGVVYVLLLTAADGLHAHAADAPTITQQHTLAIADAGHSHAPEQLACVPIHLLGVADLTHTSTSDAPTISITHVMAAADVLHTHTSDRVPTFYITDEHCADVSIADAACGAALTIGDTLLIGVTLSDAELYTTTISG